MYVEDELLLREFIRRTLNEDGWEDPQVVMFKSRPDNDDNDDKDDESDEESDATYNVNKTAEDNLTLHQRDNYAQGNRSMASFKPLAPRHAGGPQSGRSPGGTTASASRSYSAGY